MVKHPGQIGNWQPEEKRTCQMHSRIQLRGREWGVWWWWWRRRWRWLRCQGGRVLSHREPEQIQIRAFRCCAELELFILGVRRLAPALAVDALGAVGRDGSIQSAAPWLERECTIIPLLEEEGVLGGRRYAVRENVVGNAEI